MGYIARLTKGSRVLDLNSGVYSLGLDFVPPPVNIEPLLATGTAANKQGSSKRGERPLDRNWSFTVRVRGNSETQCKLAANPMLNMLALAGDEDEPLYFEYRGNDDVSSEPIYGQSGANLRYEIIHASGTQLWDRYGVAETRAVVGVNYTVNLTIKPYALGKRQRLASATGGIIEDNYATPDGRSRGVIMGQTTTNKFPNPIFGNTSDWDVNWASDASLIVQQNTDPQYCLNGISNSAKITAFSTGQRFYDNINVGNTNAHVLSCYARRPDGGAVTSSYIQLYYSTIKTTTYTAVGNGWYRLSVAVAGINANTDAGITVHNDRCVFVSGFQMEEKDYLTPLCHGDLLGHAWSSTAHNSTSTRTAGAMYLDSSLLPTMGTICAAVKCNITSSDLTSEQLPIFQASSGLDLNLEYAATPNTFVFSHNGSAASASVRNFTAGDIFVFHCVYGVGGLVSYINGASDGTGTYGGKEFTNDLYLGSSSSSTQQANWTFLDLRIYDQELTAAQVLADYNNITDHITGGDGYGQPLAPVPWLWTKDGDDTIDNCDDSTRDNWALCGGIAGNAPAHTRWIFTPTLTNPNDFDGWLGLASVGYNEFVYPDDQWYLEGGATATAATDSNSDVSTVTVSSSETALETFLSTRYGYLSSNVHMHFFARLSSSTAALQIAPAYAFAAAGTVVKGTFKAITTDSTRRWYYAGSLVLNNPNRSNSVKNMSYGIYAKRSTGSGDALTDFIMVIPDPVIKFHMDGHISAEDGFLVEGSTVLNANPSTEFGFVRCESFGNTPLDLKPNGFNYIWSMIGAHEGAHVVADTTLFNKVEITPRWELLN